MLDPEITAAIDRLLEADASEESRAENALPVYRDLGGTLLLTRDGTVVHRSSSAEAVVDADPTWRRLALIVAAERYPALASLRPVREVSSESCSQCLGRGSIDVARHAIRCGTCLGLGWV